MRSWGNCFFAMCALATSLAAPSGFADDATRYGLGSAATPEQIDAWDIDVRPDGAGLPPGEGSVHDGEPLYEEKCAQCHGSFGESLGAYPALAGGDASLSDSRPYKTVGSYWRYTSTLWDYIHRAMPFAQPESLSDHEVYAITAYVLYLNDIVDYDFVLTRNNLSDVHLPNEQNFVSDTRPDTANTRCMDNCKDPKGVMIASEAPAYVADPGPDAASIAEGRAIAADRNRGNCFACHSAEGAEMAGNAGPPLINMQQRFRDREMLKAQIAEPRTRNPETVMPPYGTHGILSDRELELVVDYVHSL